MLGNAIAERAQIKVINEYKTSVTGLDKTHINDEMVKAREYNDFVLREPSQNSKNLAVSISYMDVLNLDGKIGYIEIPKINLNIPIYHGVSEPVLKKGIGHVPTSGFPVGRLGDHSVLTGHSGILSAYLFNDLEKLEIGDRFHLHILSEQFTYTITGISTVLPEDTSRLQPEPDKSLTTLVTCTPRGVNSHRLLVHGELVAPENSNTAEIDSIETDSTTKGEKNCKILVILAILFIIMIFVAVFVYKHRSREKTDNQAAR